MPRFRVPVTWTECGEHVVEAENSTEASEQAKQLSLPVASQYVDESLRVDDEEIREVDEAGVDVELDSEVALDISPGT